MAAELIGCDLPLEQSVLEAAVPYPAIAKPVFIGHYWLTGEKPELLAPNVACLDWSVAKGGFLCAYSFCVPIDGTANRHSIRLSSHTFRPCFRGESLKKHPLPKSIFFCRH